MVAKDITKPTVVLGGNIKNILENARAVKMTGEERADSNAASTSSFFYDPPTLGLKSTQQLNVDWTNFSQHTFFSSAEVNVNVAFDQIINNFPFDGSRKEHEIFFERLTGYEKHVFDQFPKNKGYLHFVSGPLTGTFSTGSISGSFVTGSWNGPELITGVFSGSFSGSLPTFDTFIISGSFVSGTYAYPSTGYPIASGTVIIVNDYAGGKLPELSKTKTGMPVLDPELGSFTIECQLLLPTQANSTQVICQKLSGSTQGFSLFLMPNTASNTAELRFAVVSGSKFLAASSSLVKGTFNHISAMYDRTQGNNLLKIYVNESLAARSETTLNLGLFTFKADPLLIGSGSALTLGSTTYTPLQTLSGAIDEFRFFHSARTEAQIEKLARKSIFAAPELKLYFKFNEPTGTLGSSIYEGINRVVLDSSGHSLHSYISPTDFNFSLRSTGSITSPMTGEKIELSPILFPSFADVVELNIDLLVSATAYDHANPNLITKLIPSHYFLEGQASDGLATEKGTLGEGYTGTGMAGSGKLGTTQLMLSFLYVWAKFFDELKLFVDAFSSVKYVGYDPLKSSPNHFLPLVLKQYGFQVPSMFLDATIEQYIDADNIQPVISSDQYSLQYVQNEITRRVLANINEIIKSKGTQHSVRAFLRTMGIDPDNSFRIREFGGPTKQQLLHGRETKTEPALLLDFQNGGVASSGFLSASRIEPGIPFSASPFVHPGVAYVWVPTSGSFVGNLTGTFTGSAGTGSLSGSITGSFTGSFVWPGIGTSGSFIYAPPVWATMTGSFLGITGTIGSVSGAFTGTLTGLYTGSMSGSWLEIGEYRPFLQTLTTPAFVALTGSITGSIIGGHSGTFVSLNNYPYLFPDALVSPNPNDGLFTSGSFTFEAFYRWPLTRGVTSFTQSLAKIVSTGSQGQGLIFNLVAMTSSIPGDQAPSVRLYGRPTIGSDFTQAPLLFLHIDSLNIFDGARWNISFGRERNDLIDSDVSSSYFLRAASQENGEIQRYFATSSYTMLRGTQPAASSTLTNVSTIHPSGSFLVIGNQSVNSGSLFLNTGSVTADARAELFNGQITRARFWTKALTLTEWKEHVRNHKSLGVVDPLTNFNFETKKSGSWERVRLDIAMDQEERVTNSNGTIRLIDFSQNNYHMNGSGFFVSTQVINSILWPYSFISPVFDEAATNDKVRIRSFLSYEETKNSPYAAVAPVYSINPKETPTDDTRFSIEFSIMDALNRDMINIFATLDSLDNVLGNPELVFSPDYPGLEVLRNLYFNRLTDKINIKSFFEFYRWFDTSIGTFIDQLIPRKTKFFGTNFVIESHMLERPKMEYGFTDIYLGPTQRHNQKETLLVQQFVGIARKY